MTMWEGRLLNRIILLRGKNILFSNSRKTLHVYRDDPMVLPSTLSGVDHLREPHTNKGQAFTIQERQTLRIHGLLSPVYRTLEQQVQLIWANFTDAKTNLDKYKFLMSVLDRNERLFFAFVTNYIEECLPIVYTPTVGLACQRFGLVFNKPRGLFVTIYDKGHVATVLENWPEEDVKAIVVTDGERILGLGDLGAYGMGIPIGKLSLYTALAGVRPHYCLPITLDVGTNNKELLESPFYIGIRQTRVGGKEYDEFLDEFMNAIVFRYGRDCLIQFEDFGIQNAHRLLKKYREDFCTFNDDVQGTAAVVVAGLYSAMRVVNRKLKDNIILFHGAGSAALGIANLIVHAMEAEGLSKKDAQSKIWMNDVNGLIAHKRAAGLSSGQLPFAKEVPHIKGLEAIVKKVKPTIIIGVSAHKGGFTKGVLETMSRNHERPIIFALSNPTAKAECTPEEAIVATKGKCVFSSGSPFPPTTYNGKKYFTSQGNNSYIFPGIGMGVLCTGMLKIPDEVFLLAAQALAGLVTPEMLEQGSLFPSIVDIPKCSLEIAKATMKYAYATGLSTVHEPPDYELFIRKNQFNLNYPDLGAAVYDIPQHLISVESGNNRTVCNKSKMNK